MLIFPDPNVETEYTDPLGSVWEFNGTGWVRQCDCDGSGGGSGGDSDDPYWNEVSLLLKFDGVPSGTTDQWVDSTGKQTLTGYDGASISHAQAKHGDGAAWFYDSGTPPYPHLQANSSDSLILNTAFTAECWVYLEEPLTTNNRTVMASWGDGTASWMLRIENREELRAFIGNGANAQHNFTSSGAAIEQGKWHHVALSWDAQWYRIFCDGRLVGSLQSSYAPHSSSNLIFGAQETSNGSLGQRLQGGYIDDVRITKGVARYIDDFTPPGELPSTLRVIQNSAPIMSADNDSEPLGDNE